MSVTILSLGLDVLILFCLVFTIYYALKLSRSLDNFRAYRKEFNKLIKELNKNIEKAGQAIEDMRYVSDRSGDHMRKSMEQSKALIDDLELINESGEKVADRLENLIKKSKGIAQDFDEEIGEEYDEQLFSNIEHLETSMSGPQGEGEVSPFSIQDRDFEGEDVPEELQSQAERELFIALQRNKRKTASN